MFRLNESMTLVSASPIADVIETLEGAQAREEEEETARRATGRCESDRRETARRWEGRAITNGIELDCQENTVLEPVLPEKS